MFSWDAFCLDEVCRNTDSLPVERAKNCRNFKVAGYDEESDRYLFFVKCFERWSDPRGHIVTVKFEFPSIDRKRVLFLKDKQPVKEEMSVFCSCNYWRYWGASYISTQLDYALAGHFENRFPKVRDPELNNLVCKHVILVGEEILKEKTLYDLRGIRSLSSCRGEEVSDYNATRLSWEGMRGVTLVDTLPAIKAYLERNGVEEERRDALLEVLDEDNYFKVLECIGMIL